MSIEKFKNSSGEPRWRVRSYVNGRDSKYINKVFTSKLEAIEYEQSLLKEKKEIARFGSSLQTIEGTTFAREAEYWLSIKASEFSPGHLKKALGVLKELNPLIGESDPKRLHAEALFNLRKNLSLKLIKKEKTEITPATLNRKLEVVTAVLNFSAKTRRIPFYPASGFKKLVENRGDIEFWEREAAESFLNFTNLKYPRGTPKRWIHAVYVLGLNSAMRAGEIWGLQVGDIKHDSKVLHVQRQWDRVENSFRLPKGRKARFVPCNPEVREELECLIRDKNLSPTSTLFRSERGNPICHDNFTDRTFARDVLQSKLPVITFHGLRHTGTTLMIAGGVDIKTVQEICGHKNISTTMKYAHLLAESVKNVSEQFSVSASNKLRLVQG